MKTNIHTSGPWFRTVSQDNEETIYEICTAAENGEPKEIIARVNHCVITPGLAISDEVRANARLIAAAPELLQVAEDFILLADLHDWEGAAIDNARAVIAKAKGGA